MSDIVIVAILSALPATLLALATLIATLKGNTKLSQVENKVDGSLSRLLEAFTTIASTPKTVVVDGRREANKLINGGMIENKDTQNNK